ncbi:MAG: sensor histidine kinase [Bacteroidetes bacterium]|nr:sensor histidine kinase [Bacteroidota bacterium]
MRKAGLKNFNFALYAQIIFWVVLFIFILGSPQSVPASLLLLFCHMVNFYFVFSWLTPRYFEPGRYSWFGVAIVALLLTLTPFRLWIETHFINRPFLFQRGRHLIGLVLFSELTLSFLAFLFRMALDNYASRRRADQLEKGRLETELKFLKSQMSPHFLFNTINNIYALALTEPYKTRESLMKLSGLLRYLLYECNQLVPFAKELDAIESYIALFQLRYETALNITLDTQVSSSDMLIEPMLFLPLLENAIKHSDIGVVPEAFIHIRLQEEGGLLAGHFVNSKSTLPSRNEPGGIGLQNIRKRLDMLQSGFSEQNLQVRETANGFEVFIKIPCT